MTPCQSRNYVDSIGTQLCHEYRKSNVSASAKGLDEKNNSDQFSFSTFSASTVEWLTAKI
jgi:hypothetical protein